ncbi:hypothetical protein [uncultured Bacteroides sp.]|uniref:hypothetical protein n=1 Tax=uncultured Bacteroides sp. TaxID=162156 RepID=UPI0025FB6FA5|nr:hypothetical protein [uncultured Bacteroides sp.]
MKRQFVIFLMTFVFIGETLMAQSIHHPRIYVSDSDRAIVKEKISNQIWAKEAFERLRQKIDPYVKRHQSEPEWIVSRLAMYWKEGERYTQCYLKKQAWDYGEGNAPVPTVRMPGMRTWNKYYNVPLEERLPYNETGDMWGVNRTDPSAPRVLIPYKETGHMIRSNNVEILTLAEEASFLYWLTEEEKYACFATDIFNAWLLGTYYMNPILDPEQSSNGKGGYEPGGICGYYDYEQIHDDLAMHAAMIYDFTYDYLLSHPNTHLKSIGKDMTEVAGIVFKRFIDIGFVRGGKNGNWNVNGWNIMLRPILALEENEAYPDGKGRSYYLHYLTTESTPYHDAIPDILKNYDSVTGLWPESPGYSFGTVSMLLDFATLLRRTGIDIIADNPVLQKAALAAFPWMDDRANMIVFGDSRGGSANFGTFEHLLAYYLQTGDTENASRVAAALNKGISTGNYQRHSGDWTNICTYVAVIPESGKIDSERTSYSPHHRLITMKSESSQENLMAVLYGGRKGYHLTPNGLALQIYGFGYALAPDASGYESYWSKDQVYHQSPTGSNTILPGYAEGEITVRAMEPCVNAGSFVNIQSLNPHINMADLEAAEKRRVVAMIKTAPGKGYYIDIFRSNQADNDYLFHNVGKSLKLKTIAGQLLSLSPVDGFETTYHQGYNWFKNLHKISYKNDFRATWEITSDEEPMSMQMWMLGVDGRELYSVEAPYTTLQKSLTPDNVSMAPASTPTLIVRQTDNNAWDSPFVSVFEPTKGSASVIGVEKLRMDRMVSALCVESEGMRKDYVLSTTSPDVIFSSGKHLAFQGTFGLITELPDGIEQIYMVDGRKIKKGKYAIESSEPVSVSVYRKEGEWFYSSTGKATVKLGKKVYLVEAGYHQSLK